MVNDLVSTRSEKEDNLNNLENKLEIQTNGISALEGEITVKEYDNYDGQKKSDGLNVKIKCLVSRTTTINMSAHVYVKSPSNISADPSKVIPIIYEP